MKPKKSLGQNFLVNRGILEKIVSAANLIREDTVLEIGPGTGILTEALAQKVRSTDPGQAGRVIAVEKDYRLIEPLRKKFEAYPNVEIVEGDILNIDIWRLLRNSKLEIRNSDYKVVGNIPYYITSHLLKTIFEEWPKPSLIILMVQHEVAQRICDTQQGSLLSLSVQYYAEPKIIARVSPGSFRPAPKVDSAILKLTPRYTIHDTQHMSSFFRLIKAGFAHKRKRLFSNLIEAFPARKDAVSSAFTALDINSSERAQNLSLEKWLKLAEIIAF